MYKKTVLKIFLTLILFFLIYSYWENIQALDVQEFIAGLDNIFYAVFILLGFYTAKSIFFIIPLLALHIASGMVFPLYLAIPLSSLGFVLEISLTYFYGYFLGNDFVENILSRHAKFRQLLDYNMDNDLYIPFLLRITPVAIEPVSLILGASGNFYWHFILGSLMGALPKIVLFTMIGDAIVNPVTRGSLATFVIVGLLWLLAAYKLRKYWRKINGKKDLSPLSIIEN